MKTIFNYAVSLILFTAVVAHAQLETLLTTNPGNSTSASLVWTVNANGNASEVANGNSVPTTGSLANSSGSFTFTWTSEYNFNETTLAGTLSDITGNKWAYNGGAFNFGPVTPNGTSIQLEQGEGVVMAFDLSNLNLDPGFYLRLDHIRIQNNSGGGDAGARFSFWDQSRSELNQLTGPGGVLITPATGDSVAQTLNQEVGTGDELAMWRANLSGQVRITGFQFSVVPEQPPVANDDSLTLNPNNKVLIPILNNDTNLNILDHITIVSQPTSGTATSVGNQIRYEHTTGSPVSDSFMYELVDQDSRTSGVATVTIHFSSNLRLESTTLNIPSTPPVDSYNMVDAFSGISFSQPLSLTSPPGETDRLFVCEKPGLIQLISDVDGTPSKSVFFDLATLINARSTEVIHTGGESGLLGLAFHPNYAANGYFYIFYSVNINGVLHERVSRFSVSGNPDLADAGSEQILIEQLDQANNHNGGDIQFGPDGYLYISVGDEGGGNDAFNNSPFITKNYFAGILRIDVDKLPGNLEPNAHASVPTDGGGDAYYSVPSDNHWVGATSFNGIGISPNDVITEFYAVGLRNPWRIHFDPGTGELYAADVGQGAREEVNIITNGGNYGWAYFEASLAGPFSPAPAGFVHSLPIYEYTRGTGVLEGRSISGGVVYRGTTYTDLIGKYVFGDYVSGNIWTMDRSGPSVVVERITGTSGPVGFGYDPSNGDVLIADINLGQVRRLVAGDPVDDFPETLSETGIFADLADLSPNPGVLGYDPNLRFWSDYAIKTRWFSVPDTNDTVTYAEEGPWTYPTGMIWVKHFDMELERGNPTTKKRLETRLLVKNDTGAYGVSYRWNEAETEAYLVPAAGESFTLSITNNAIPTNQVWAIPSRSQCMICHLPNAGHALSFDTRQLNKDYVIGGVFGNQIDTLRDAGYLTDAPNDVSDLPRHLRPDETQASLEARVRSYIAVNCAYCHQEGGGNPAGWDGRSQLSLLETALINGHVSNNGGDAANRLIVPGDSDHSVVLSRIAGSNGFDRMPPLASSEVDQEGVTLIQDWINNELSQTHETYTQWRLTHFGSTNSPAGDPVEDFDGDSRDNQFEWLTRTDPLNSNDVWKANIIPNGLGGLEINYTSILNRMIEINESTNLVDWTQFDHPANHGYPSPDSNPETIDIPNPDASKRFYRFNIQE